MVTGIGPPGNRESGQAGTAKSHSDDKRGKTFMRIRLVTLVVAMLMVSVGLWAQNDPVMGTWKLNVAKSTYSPGPAPKSGTTKITAVSGGLMAMSNGVDAEGKATRTEISVKFDGKDYPITNTTAGKPTLNAADATTFKKIDANTYERTDKLKGQVLTTTHWSISQDGKTRTLTATGKNAQGQTVNNTTVYEKI
jgi:hypothetical protein